MRSPLGRILNRTPVPYVGAGRLSFPFVQRNDAQAQMRAMGSVGTVFAIVNKTSTGVAEIEWTLYRTRDGRGRIAGEEDRKPVERHAAIDLWDRPNPFYSRYDLVETVQQHIDLTGEGWIVISRGRRGTSPIPLELWPVRPDRMEPVPSPTEFLSGYIYTGPDGEKVPLGLQDVIQIKMPNPLDPYRGLGPVQSILVDIDSDRYSAEWNANFFRNSAEPGGIVEVPNTWSDGEFKDFQKRWREQHQGVNQAHRVGVLEGGAKWVERKFTQRDMQFTQLREVSRDIIREAFGVHKAILGISDDVNRANAEAGEYVFGRWVIRPRLGRWKGALNERLLPLFGDTSNGVEWDYEDPTSDSPEQENAERESKAKSFGAYIRAGVDPADAAEVCGLPELKMAPKPEPPPQFSPNGDQPAEDDLVMT